MYDEKKFYQEGSIPYGQSSYPNYILLNDFK